MTAKSKEPSKLSVVWFLKEGAKEEAIWLLEDIERDAEGNITKGHVVNGRWTLRIAHGEMRACENWDNRIVHDRAKGKITREVPIPKNRGGDYNARIAWAEKQKGG